MTPPSMTRRNFVRAAALAPLATLPTPAAAPQRVPVVDTHVHCFAGTNSDRFPYHANAPYRPEEESGPDLLLKVMKGAGVDYAVVVHPEPYQDDHRYLEYCLREGQGKLKGTCLFFAGRPDSAEKMSELVKRCPVAALRIHAYAPERLPPFGKPELRALWKHAAGLGLMIQLHFEPRYAPGFAPLIKEFRDTKVIIDHLGRPFQGTPDEHAEVLRWARLPNTVLKVSAVPSERQYPHRDIRPVIKQLTDAFGAERMIYGGGFGAGVTAERYRAERERIASYLSHLSEADRAKVLGGTAARLFGFAG